MPSISNWSTGVYKITNRLNNKVYVGGAYEDMSKRLKRHRTLLRLQRHHNRHLQSAWNLYGPKAFTYSIIEWCSPIRVKDREDYWISSLKATDPLYGYNICPKAGSSLGREHTEETKKVLSDKAKQQMQSEEARARISESNKGRKHSDEAKAKMSASRMGKKRSEEAIAKASASNKGKKRSQGVRKKMSDAAKRRWTDNPMTDEQRKKWSEVKIGSKHKPETRDKMSKMMSEGMRKKFLYKGVRSEETRNKISQNARNISDETRRKRSEAAKAQWARIKKKQKPA